MFNSYDSNYFFIEILFYNVFFLYGKMLCEIYAMDIEIFIILYINLNSRQHIHIVSPTHAGELPKNNRAFCGVLLRPVGLWLLSKQIGD